MASGVLQCEAGLQCGLVGCSHGLPMQIAFRCRWHSVRGQRDDGCKRLNASSLVWPNCIEQCRVYGGGKFCCNKKRMVCVPGDSAQPKEICFPRKKNLVHFSLGSKRLAATSLSAGTAAAGFFSAPLSPPRAPFCCAEGLCEVSDGGGVQQRSSGGKTARDGRRRESGVLL